MFGVEGNDVVIATLDVHCKFPNWSVKIRLFNPILEAFESVIQIQYFFEKSFFISFIIQNYSVGPTVIFRIDSVLVREQEVVPTDYRYIENGEYTAFGRQFDNNRLKIDFGNGIKVDL